MKSDYPTFNFKTLSDFDCRLFKFGSKLEYRNWRKMAMRLTKFGPLDKFEYWNAHSRCLQLLNG